MRTQYTYTYWKDGALFVGQVREIPGAISQGATLAELEDNLRDAIRLIQQDQPAPPRNSRVRKLALAGA